MRRLLAVLIAVVGLLVGCGFGQPYTFQGGVLDPPQRAPEISVTDQHGQPFRLTDQLGKVVMLYFGYTNCPDECPTTLSDLKGVRQELGSDANNLRVVMVTVDPTRDTPEVMSRYLAQFDPSFIGLTPSAGGLMGLERAYHIDSQTSPSVTGGTAAAATTATTGQNSYEVGHTSLVYVIDRKGQLRLAYPTGFGVKAMVSDVRYLLHHA